MSDSVIVDRNGISWHEAPRPRRWHRCATWSSGVINAVFIERCACGAIRINSIYWLNKNNRRKRR